MNEVFGATSLVRWGCQYYAVIIKPPLNWLCGLKSIYPLERINSCFGCDVALLILHEAFTSRS